MERCLQVRRRGMRLVGRQGGVEGEVEVEVELEERER